MLASNAKIIERFKYTNISIYHNIVFPSESWKRCENTNPLYNNNDFIE